MIVPSWRLYVIFLLLLYLFHSLFFHFLAVWIFIFPFLNLSLLSSKMVFPVSVCSLWFFSRGPALTGRLSFSLPCHDLWQFLFVPAHNIFCYSGQVVRFSFLCSNVLSRLLFCVLLSVGWSESFSSNVRQ